jgi:hypothetical protein
VRFQRKKLMEIQPPCKQRGRHEDYLHRNNQKKNEKTLDQTSRAIGTQLMLQVLGKSGGVGIVRKQQQTVSLWKIENIILHSQQHRFLATSGDGSNLKLLMAVGVKEGGSLFQSSQVELDHPRSDMVMNCCNTSVQSPKGRKWVWLAQWVCVFHVWNAISWGSMFWALLQSVGSCQRPKAGKTSDFYFHNSSSSTGSGSELNKRKRASKKRAKGDDG